MSRLIQNLRKLKKYKKLSSDLDDNISVIKIFKKFNFSAVYFVLFYSLYYLILPTNDMIINSDYLLLFYIINSIHLIINIHIVLVIANCLLDEIIEAWSFLLNLSISIFLGFIIVASFFSVVGCLIAVYLMLFSEPLSLNGTFNLFNYFSIYYLLCAPLFIFFFILSYRMGDKKIKLNKTTKLKNEIGGKISNIIEENEKFKSNKIELIKATDYLNAKDVIDSDIFNLNEYLDGIKINHTTKIRLDNQCKLDYITNNNILKKDIKIEND